MEHTIMIQYSEAERGAVDLLDSLAPPYSFCTANGMVRSSLLPYLFVGPWGGWCQTGIPVEGGTRVTIPTSGGRLHPDDPQVVENRLACGMLCGRTHSPTRLNRSEFRWPTKHRAMEQILSLLDSPSVSMSEDVREWVQAHWVSPSVTTLSLRRLIAWAFVPRPSGICDPGSLSLRTIDKRRPFAASSLEWVQRLPRIQSPPAPDKAPPQTPPQTRRTNAEMAATHLRHRHSTIEEICADLGCSVSFAYRVRRYRGPLAGMLSALRLLRSLPASADWHDLSLDDQRQAGTYLMRASTSSRPFARRDVITVDELDRAFGHRAFGHRLSPLYVAGALYSSSALERMIPEAFPGLEYPFPAPPLRKQENP